MRLYKKLDKNIEEIKKLNGNSSDLCIRNMTLKGKKIAIIYLESVSSDNKVSDILIKSIINVFENYSFLDDVFKTVYKKLENSIYNSNLSSETEFDKAYLKLTNGFSLVLIEGYPSCISIETRETLDRGITEPGSQRNTVGPKDAFTENHNKNIGLIRKRIKNESLKFKEFIVGTRSHSKVSVCYIDDIVLKDSLEKVLEKIDKIDIDAIIDSGYIRSFLTDEDRSHFPTVIQTERPDTVCASILEGKIAILVENTPFVLVVPAYLNNFIHASEDSYQKARNVSMTRTLRFIAFIITIFVPGFYIAVTTFNQEVIPDTLLTSLAIQKAAVPFPTSVAVFVLMITFEILRETDLRIPETMGTSISIVGALVLGEAVVNAGIVSPIVVLIVAISAITGMLFNDMDLVNALRWWKLLFILFSSCMGLIGFLCISIIFITTLCSIDIFGISYMVPFSPLVKSALKDTYFVVPRNKMKTRPPYLTKNVVRMGDSDED